MASPDRDELFADGVRALEESEYRQAFEAFDALIVSGHGTGAVYLNYASAAVSLGRDGEARWALRKAENYSEVRHEASERGRNLDRRLGTSAPGRAQSGIVLLFWILGVVTTVVSAAALVFGKNLRVGLVTGAVLIILAIGASASGELRPIAVVVTPDAELYPSARQLAIPAGSITEGAVIRIRRKDGARVEVVAPDGSRGWVDRHRIREL